VPFVDGDGDQYDKDSELIWNDTTNLTDRWWKSGVDVGAYAYQFSTKRPPSEIPGPLRADLTVTAGTAYPNLTVTAPLGPEFQAIPEWTGGAAVDLSTLVPTANTRKGDVGVAVWSEGLNAVERVIADDFLNYEDA